MDKDVIRLDVEKPEKTIEQEINESVAAAIGDLGTAHNYKTYETDTDVDAGEGVAMPTGVVTSTLAELMLIKNEPYDSRFVPGTLLYVSKDAEADGTTKWPIMTSEGVEVGYSAVINPGRPATVEEAMVKLKYDIQPLSNG